MTFQRAIVRNEQLSSHQGRDSFVISACIFGSTIVCRGIKRPLHQRTIYFRWRIVRLSTHSLLSRAFLGSPGLPRAAFIRSFVLSSFPSFVPSFLGKCVTRRSTITPCRSSGESKNYTLPGAPNEFLFNEANAIVRGLECTSARRGFRAIWREDASACETKVDVLIK